LRGESSPRKRRRSAYERSVQRTWKKGESRWSFRGVKEEKTKTGPPLRGGGGGGAEEKEKTRSAQNGVIKNRREIVLGSQGRKKEAKNSDLSTRKESKKGWRTGDDKRRRGILDAGTRNGYMTCGHRHSEDQRVADRIG